MSFIRDATCGGNGGNYDLLPMQHLYAAMDEANYHPHTVASAIEISRPVNLPKALRALEVRTGWCGK